MKKRRSQLNRFEPFVFVDTYGKDHSIVNIDEFYLYNQSLNCYCSGFLYDQAELTNMPTKINEVELQAAIKNGFNCDERWVIK
ncbi:hypothetical protein AX764_04265 [Oenococcus oeni]|nr:hypothetical protein AX764_04265 [Oenococcus oeni]